MEAISQYLQQAKAYQRNKQYELAIEQYNSAIQIEDHNFEPYYWRGFCYYQIDDPENALDDFTTTIRLKPDHTKAYYWRALAYLGVEDAANAIEDLNQAIKLNPQDFMAYYRRATIFNQINEPQNALQDLEQAIKLNPDYFDTLFLRAKIKHDLGDNQRALEELNKLINLQENHAEVYKLRGLAKRKLKNFDECLSDLEQAAELYQQQGNSEKAQEIQQIIATVSEEKIAIETKIPKTTLDSINLDSEKRKLEQLIRKDNPIVYKFDQSMIKTYLKKNEIPYLEDNEGDLIIRFGYDERIDCELTVYLMVSGENKSIYNISIRSNKRILKKQWDEAVIICNQWNLQARWPGASFYAKSTDEKYGVILLEYHLLLEAGIHQELLDSITSQVISAGYKFWYEANEYL